MSEPLDALRNALVEASNALNDTPDYAGTVRFEHVGTPAVALLIDTLEGTHRANRGDWIIRGIKDELYSCKPDIFEATYELVEVGT